MSDETLKLRDDFGHVPELDGIRAAAVAIVVVAHLGFERVIPGGFGVTVFFFLSGYLITSLLVAEQRRTGTVSLKGFYLRRTFRIIPPFVLTMLFALLLVALDLLHRDFTAGGVALQLLFLHNYKEFFGVGDGMPILAWSLAVEEHFYLVFPLLFMVFLSRMPGRQAALWCAVGCAFALAFRLWSGFISEDMLRLNYTMSHTRMDSILFGSMLALWNNPVLDRDAWRPKFWHAVVALAVILVGFVIRDEFFRQTIRYTMQGAALFVLFSYALQAGGIVRVLLSSGAARWIGLLSYTIYLIHPVWIEVMTDNFPDMHPAAFMSIVISLTLAYSYAMYVLIEKPAGRIRRRLESRPRPALAA